MGSSPIQRGIPSSRSHLPRFLPPKTSTKPAAPSHSLTAEIQDFSINVTLSWMQWTLGVDLDKTDFQVLGDLGKRDLTACVPLLRRRLDEKGILTRLSGKFLLWSGFLTLSMKACTSIFESITHLMTSQAQKNLQFFCSQKGYLSSIEQTLEQLKMLKEGREGNTYLTKALHKLYQDSESPPDLNPVVSAFFYDLTEAFRDQPIRKFFFDQAIYWFICPRAQRKVASFISKLEKNPDQLTAQCLNKINDALSLDRQENWVVVPFDQLPQEETFDWENLTAPSIEDEWFSVEKELQPKPLDESFILVETPKSQTITSHFKNLTPSFPLKNTISRQIGRKIAKLDNQQVNPEDQSRKITTTVLRILTPQAKKRKKPLDVEKEHQRLISTLTTRAEKSLPSWVRCFVPEGTPLFISKKIVDDGIVKGVRFALNPEVIHRYYIPFALLLLSNTLNKVLDSSELLPKQTAIRC